MEMEAREQLGERLKSDLPFSEAPALLERTQREKALQEAPETNSSKFEDERTQQFSNLWFSQRETATVEQKDKVGLAYISKALGFGDEVAEVFAKGDRDVFHAVGMKQSAIPIDTDVSGFWEEIRGIFPEVYTDEDILFLVTEGKVAAVLHFLWQLEVPLAEESPVLRRLAVNAHAHK